MSVKSKSHRDSGNKLYSKKRMGEALEEYTKAVLEAPPPSKESR